MWLLIISFDYVFMYGYGYGVWYMLETRTVSFRMRENYCLVLTVVLLRKLFNFVFSLLESELKLEIHEISCKIKK